MIALIQMLFVLVTEQCDKEAAAAEAAALYGFEEIISRVDIS